MKVIRKVECEICNNLIWDSSWDAYICTNKTGINQYIGETKWQISGDETEIICPKN